MGGTMAARIYLAGFDTYYADAMVQTDAVRQLCADLGFVSVFPAQVVIDSSGEVSPELAATIFQRDVDLLRTCDIVAASLFSSDGVESISDIAFELGYAHALGKPLFAYSPREMEGSYGDCAGVPINRMLSVPATMVYGNLTECLQRIRLEVADGIAA